MGIISRVSEYFSQCFFSFYDEVTRKLRKAFAITKNFKKLQKIKGKTFAKEIINLRTVNSLTGKFLMIGFYMMGIEDHSLRLAFFGITNDKRMAANQFFTVS